MAPAPMMIEREARPTPSPIQNLPHPAEAGWAARSDRRGKGSVGRTRRAGTRVEDPKGVARRRLPALAGSAAYPVFAGPTHNAATRQRGDKQARRSRCPSASDQNRDGQEREAGLVAKSCERSRAQLEAATALFQERRVPAHRLGVDSSNLRRKLARRTRIYVQFGL